jgi:hypothetical protein
MAPVYVKLPTDGIRVGQAVQKHGANILDVTSYIRGEGKGMTPPRQGIRHRELNRGRGHDVIFLFAPYLVLEAMC